MQTHTISTGRLKQSHLVHPRLHRWQWRSCLLYSLPDSRYGFCLWWECVGHIDLYMDPLTPFLSSKFQSNLHEHNPIIVLVGGWTNPIETYLSNWITSPRIGVKNTKIFELPPPSCFNHPLHSNLRGQNSCFSSPIYPIDSYSPIYSLHNQDQLVTHLDIIRSLSIRDHPRIEMCWHSNQYIHTYHLLVGGFNPFEKY